MMRRLAEVAKGAVVNLGTASVRLPRHDSMLPASGPLDDGRLPTDTAVWLSPLF